eukprot:c11755_g1_i1.p1 GENE.c11755_g1_i1~~c11755_g1_i1.p1  ORF type:complete len:522 (-),score=190.57 c11755_g1_i1:188-1726(-)
MVKKMSKTTGLVLVLLSVFIDMVGLSIALPIIPYLAIEFGANAQQLGFLYAGFAGAQMIATPITGKASDKFGRRPILLLSLLGSFFGFLIQGIARDYVTFLIGRIVLGTFGGSLPVAQAYIAANFDVKQRPKYFAWLGSVTSTAFMFGPGIGAGLSQFTLQTPMFVSAGVAGIGFLITLLMYHEESNKPTPNQGTSVSDQAIQPSSSQNPIQSNQENGSQSNQESRPNPPTTSKENPTLNQGRLNLPIRLLYLVSLFTMWGFSAFIYFFGLLIFDRLGFGSLEYGFASMATSVLGVVVQTLLYQSFQRKSGKHGSGIIGAILMGIGLVLMSFLNRPLDSFTGLPLLCISLTIMSIGFSFTTPSLSATLSRYTSASSQGSVMGVSQGLQSLARTVGPILWGSMYESSSTIPFIIAGVCCFVGAALNFLVLMINRRFHAKENTPIRRQNTDDEIEHEAAGSEMNDIRDISDVNELKMEIQRLREKIASYESKEMKMTQEDIDTVVMSATLSNVV